MCTAEENQAYVRGLLWEKDPGWAVWVEILAEDIITREQTAALAV